MRVTPLALAYFALGVGSLARAVTWIATGWGNTVHVGALSHIPNGIVATAWVLAGVLTMTGAWHFKARAWGLVLTAILNTTVGVASLFNRAIVGADGVTASVAVSYLVIALIAVALPRLTDMRTILETEAGDSGPTNN